MENTDRKRIARRRFLKLLGLAAGVCIGVPADARYIEPQWVELTRHTVYLPDLPLDLDGLVIAQLTDLHHGPLTAESTIRESIRFAANAHPDLVVHTGDFVNHKTEDAIRLASLLTPLRGARFGSYGCLGNHDYGDYSGDAVARAMTTGAPMRMLRNASHRIAPGLYIAGIEDTCSGSPDYSAAFTGVPNYAAVIFLTHNPVGVFGGDSRACLTLSGHTHGGQVRIPGIPPARPCGMEGFPMIEGWGLFDRARLYISRGVGLMCLPLRFRCRPEVAVFTLRRGDRMPETHPDAPHRAVRKVARFTKATLHRFI